MTIAAEPGDRGWVEVRDEPRHRRRFENGLVRVYDVAVPPGDTTLYHRHTEDTFYVAVNEATVCDRTFGVHGERTGTALAGSLLCRAHRNKPLIHQVTNVGQGEMRLIGAEIKDRAPVLADEALVAPGVSLSVERDRLRAYHVDLGPGESTGEVDYRFFGLTVFLSVASLLVRPDVGPERSVLHNPGDVVWQPGPVTLSITNIGEHPCRWALGEWR